MIFKLKLQEYCIEEYKNVLSGKRKRFTRGFWETKQEEKARIVFKYLFEEILKWDIDRIINEFDSKTVSEYNLGTPFNIVYGKCVGNVIKDIYPDSIGLRLPMKKETKLKISNAQKNLSPEKRERITRGQRENRYCEEYAKKLSDTKLGEINPQHKLKTEQVIEIKKLWETKEYTTTSLGEKFGVKRQTIADIVYGRTWKHV